MQATGRIAGLPRRGSRLGPRLADARVEISLASPGEQQQFDADEIFRRNDGTAQEKKKAVEAAVEFFTASSPVRLSRPGSLQSDENGSLLSWC